MADLEKILADMNCHPKAAVIDELMKGTVESLTAMKLKLYDKCRAVEDFPMGEFYTRRKPKGASAYSSLEERLADDIFELSNCLDTGIVTAEVKNMFKAPNVVINDDHSEATPTNCVYQPEEISHSSADLLNRSSGWSGLRSQISSLQSGYMLFREKVTRDFTGIEKKVKDLEVIVKSQNNEIALLKQENKRLSELCINYSSINAQSPLGASLCAYLNEEAPTIMDTNNCDDTEKDDREPNVSNELSRNISSKRGAPLSLQLSYSDALKRSTQNENHAPNENISNSNSPARIDSADNIAVVGNSKGLLHSKLQEKSKQSESDTFIGVKRTRVYTKRFFLSGIAENVSKDTIIRFLDKKGVTPTLLNLFPNKRKGTSSAKVNVHIKDSKRIEEDGFWPTHVYCRPWLSKERFLRHFSSGGKKTNQVPAERNGNDQPSSGHSSRNNNGS